MNAGGHLRAAWHVVRLINLRHMLGRRRRAVLTLAGIAASVSLVVAIMVVNQTLRNAIDGTTRGLAGSASLEVAPASAEALPPGALAALGQIHGVREAVPLLRQVTVVRGPGGAPRTFVFGVPANLAALFPEGLGDAAGQLGPGRFRHGMLASPGLASQLAAARGARLAIATAAGAAHARLAGVLGRGPFAALNGGDFGLLPLSVARRVFAQPGGTSLAYVVLRRGAALASVRRSIRRRLGTGVAVRTPGGGATAYKRTFDSIALVSEQTRIVALLVALFLVYNTMSMALAERRSELVLLKLDGARSSEAVLAFVLEAAILGTLGSALGVGLGAALASALVQHAANAYSILPLTDTGSIILSPSAVAVGLGSGIAVSVFGALLPAGRIIRAKPIDALRPEGSYEWSGRRISHPAALAGIGSLLLGAAAAISVLVPTQSHSWVIGVAFAGALIGAALLLPLLVPLLARALRASLLLPLGVVGRLAGDTLLRNPVRAMVVAGALALSASVVISVGSGLGSYDHEIEQASAMWYAAPLYVDAPGPAIYTADQPMPDSFRQALGRVRGVRAAYPSRYGLIDEGGRQLMVYAMPIAAAAAAGDHITRGVGIPQGRFVGAMRRGEIVLSRFAARRRGLGVGDWLRLPAIAGRRRLRIAGLFNDLTTMDTLYMELSAYRRFTGDNLANRFAIMLRRGADPAQVAARLRRLLRQRRIAATVLTRAQQRATVLRTIEGLFSLAKSIQVAALLLAGLIALNTMLTATFERRREFGLQRTIGMSRAQLAGAVILESVSVSLIAAVIAAGLGLGMGFLMTLTIENQLAWRIAFSPALGLALGTVLATLSIGALAALYPSWRAGRQPLIELVAYE